MKIILKGNLLVGYFYEICLVRNGPKGIMVENTPKMWGHLGDIGKMPRAKNPQTGCHFKGNVHRISMDFLKKRCFLKIF